MRTFLERYHAGEHVAVWDDLMSLGAGVRHELYYADDAAVAAETMRRARRNVELLIQRLDAMDYRFLTMNESDEFHLEGLARSRQTTAPGSYGIGKKRKPPLKDPDVLAPPDKHAARDLKRLEKLAGGPLPLSLRAWYEQVGGVSLLGWHSMLSPGPDEPAGREGIAPDPLMICSLDDLIQMLEIEPDEEAEGEIRLELAPDAIFKAGEGGGGPYDMVIPNPCADGIFGDCNGRTFVNYLRNAFHWGGFPGWEDSRTPPHREIAALREGLLPL